MSFLFGAAGVYSCDLELFKQLGLTQFSTTDNKELFVGEHKLPHHEKASIKIFVSCYPAHFWRFEIKTDEDKKFEISTGSGSLSTYWPSVVLVAQGMFSIKKWSREPKRTNLETDKI